MKANDLNMTQDYRGPWFITFQLDKEDVPEAMRLIDTLKGKTIEITAKLFRPKRSLTANAYFHVLCDKLAARLRISNDACKRMMVRAYGSPAEVNGSPVTITLPKGSKPEDFYPYCEWVYGDEDGDTYQLLKQTHTLNSSEFARLIDGLVDECKEQGIETLPPAELARLYAQADKGHGNTD